MIHVSIMIESNNDFSIKFWNNKILIYLCFLVIIVGIFLHYYYLKIMIILSGLTALFLLYIFYDSIPENADSEKINIISPLIIFLISMFYPINLSFFKKHTDLIGMRLTMKQKASIDSYANDCRLRNINLDENDPGYPYLNYNFDPTWKEFFSNFKYFFFEREVPKSKISIYYE